MDMGVTLDMLSSHNTHPKATRLEFLLDECDHHIDQLHQLLHVEGLDDCACFSYLCMYVATQGVGRYVWFLIRFPDHGRCTR